MDVISPLDGTVLTTMARGTAQDASDAIAAARQAFDEGPWSGRAPAKRKAIMLKWADLIEENAVELAVLGLRNNGTEIGMAFKAEPYVRRKRSGITPRLSTSFMAKLPLLRPMPWA